MSEISPKMSRFIDILYEMSIQKEKVIFLDGVCLDKGFRIKIMHLLVKLFIQLEG